MKTKRDAEYTFPISNIVEERVIKGRKHGKLFFSIISQIIRAEKFFLGLILLDLLFLDLLFIRTPRGKMHPPQRPPPFLPKCGPGVYHDTFYAQKSRTIL